MVELISKLILLGRIVVIAIVVYPLFGLMYVVGFIANLLKTLSGYVLAFTTEKIGDLFEEVF